MTSPTRISRRRLLVLAGAVPILFAVYATTAWSDDRQIVSTVANATLAVARAGGSPSAYKQLLVRYAAVQGVALLHWAAIARGCRPTKRGSM